MRRSVCINRQQGMITLRPVCAEDKEPCAWWRAVWCTGWDVLRSAWAKVIERRNR